MLEEPCLILLEDLCGLERFELMERLIVTLMCGMSEEFESANI